MALVLFCLFAIFATLANAENVDVTSDSGITLDGTYSGDAKVDIGDVTTTPTVTETTTSSGMGARSVGALVGFVAAAVCLS